MLLPCVILPNLILYLSQLVIPTNSKTGDKKVLNLNQEKFSQVVKTALTNTTNSKRWRNAIVRAAVEIEVNPYMELIDGALLILSPSNEIYEANGACSCKAFASGKPCWHRAAARLVERYNEASH
jgi:hypothetical protein